MRRAAILLAALFLSACLADPVRLGPLTTATPQVAAQEQVFVATSREPVDDPNRAFGPARSRSLHFAEATVSIPLAREAGSISYPSAHPDPKRDFTVASLSLTEDEAAFAARLRAALAARPKGERNLFLFVHGYNVTFAQGLFSAAQLRHDYKVPGVALHYSWPSAEKTALYLYDRDSAEFARDGLVRTLKIAEAARPESVIVLAHSMGTLLTMEAMRTLSLKGDAGPANSMSALILAAPDIDIDVFRSQLAQINPRPKAMIVLVSEQDKALKLSGELRGGAPRVGSGANKDELAGEGLVVLDIAALTQKGDPLSHSTYANSELLIKLVNGGLNLSALEKAKKGNKAGIIGDSLGLAGDLLSSIVYLPAKVVGAR